MKRDLFRKFPNLAAAYVRGDFHVAAAWVGVVLCGLGLGWVAASVL